MAQNLLTTNNIQPNPPLVNGTLIASGYISPNDFDFTVPSTLKAGSYVIQHFPAIAYAATTNFGEQLDSSPSVTDRLLHPSRTVSLSLDENNFRIQPNFIQLPTGRYLAGTFGNSSNLIHDGTNYMYVNIQSLTGILCFSTDLITWSTRTADTGSNANITNVSGFNLFYFPSLTNKYYFLTNKALANTQIRYSTDAVTWASATCPAITSGIGFRGMAFNNNMAQKLVTYDTGPASQKIATSTDGITWSSRTSGFTDPITAVITNNAASGEVYLISVAISSGANSVATSTDGITWTSRSTGVSAPAQFAVWINNLYSVVYNGISSHYCTTSTNGTTWTIRELPAGIGNGASVSAPSAIVNNIAFGYTTSTKNIYSTDGISWRSMSSTLLATIPQIYVNGVYWAVQGTNGTLCRPPFSAYYAIYEIDNQAVIT